MPTERIPLPSSHLATPAPGLARLLASVAAHAETDVYLVGGALRDLLRGNQPADLDFAVVGDAGRLAHAVAGGLAGSVFGLDAERGQMRVVLPEGAAVRELDFAPLKGDDIDADLRSRDFTIDALAAPIDAAGRLGDLIDPTGGQADLDAHSLRVVSEAALVADPLRLLRGVRLAVQLDFAIEDATRGLIQEHAALLGEAAPERQRDELVRILATPRAAAGVRLLDELGLLGALLPELLDGHGVDQPVNHHYYDVFDHSVAVLAALDAMLAETAPPVTAGLDFRGDLRAGLAWYPLDAYLDGRCGGQSRRVLLKLAGLLHDVSKPETKAADATGRIRFLGHPELGARKTKRIATRLRFGSREAAFVALLVDEHLRPTQLAPAHAAPSRRAVYRFFRDLDEAAPACLLLALADGAGAAGPRLQPERWRGMIAYSSWLLAAWDTISAEPAIATRLVGGHDLMATLSIEGGPLVGRLLSALDDAIGAGELTTREQAIEHARALLASWQVEAAEKAS